MASREMRRQVILEAMISVVGTQGYQATSVGDVVAEASASRATFYKYFDDKRDCFLAAYELAAERVIAVATGGCAEGVGPWPAPARAGLAAVVELFSAEPELARTVLVEAAAAGDEARRRHWAAVGRIASLLDQGRPRRPRLPPKTSMMAVSGVAALIFDALRAGRGTELAQLLPELEYALLVPFVGPEAAAEGSRTAAYSRSL